MNDSAKTSLGFSVIPATTHELALAADLRQAMAKEMGDDWEAETPGWKQRFIEYFSKKQESGNCQCFLARTSDSMVGMLTVSMVDDYHGYVRGRVAGRINAVYVAPDVRRCGIGRALMLAALDWLRERGCVVVRLNSSEEGVKLYESLNFKPRREMELYLQKR